MLGLQRTAGNRAVARYVESLEAARIGPTPSPDAILDSRDERLHPHQLAAGAEVPGIAACYGEAVEPVIDVAHHWIEIGTESYGWWPREEVAQSVLWTGVPGELNGTTLYPGVGTPTRDPHHGDPARRHAVVVTTGSFPLDLAAATARAADRIRAFARGYSDAYTWSPWGTDCHEFVEDALADAGLRASARLLP